MGEVTQALGQEAQRQEKKGYPHKLLQPHTAVSLAPVRRKWITRRNAHHRVRWSYTAMTEHGPPSSTVILQLDRRIYNTWILRSSRRMTRPNNRPVLRSSR